MTGRRRLFLLTCGVLLSGCIDAPQQPEPKVPTAPVDDFQQGSEIRLPCARCFEPTLAWTPSGNLVVSDWGQAPRIVHPDGEVRELTIPFPPFPETPSFTEDSVVVSGSRLWYLVASHGPTVSFDNRLFLFGSDDEGTTWSIRHEFTPGASSVLQRGNVDRAWLAQSGPHVVILWNELIAQSTDFVISSNGGATFGQVQSLPARIMSDLVPRPAVSDEGRIVVPVLEGKGVVPSRPGVGSLAALASVDAGKTWKEQNVWVGAGNEAPHERVFFTGSLWTPDFGFAMAWQATSGAVYGVTSKEGELWSPLTTIWPARGKGIHPWMAWGDGRLTLSQWSEPLTEGAGPRSLTYGTWTPGGEISPLETSPGPNESPGEFSAHASRGDGLTALLIPTADHYRILFRAA